jgi:hypothetical protein
VNIPNIQLCSSCHKPLTSISYNKIIQEAEQTKRELTELKAKQQEGFKEMQEKMKAQQEHIEGLVKLALKQSFRVIEQEVAVKPPPYVEDAANKTPQELLLKLKEKGYTTFAFEK